MISDVVEKFSSLRSQLYFGVAVVGEAQQLLFLSNLSESLLVDVGPVDVDSDDCLPFPGPIALDLRPVLDDLARITESDNRTPPGSF